MNRFFMGIASLVLVVRPAYAAQEIPPVNAAALVICGILFVIFLIYSFAKELAASDPSDSTAATIENLPAKLEALEPGEYEVTFIRQSGNVHRVLHCSSPDEAIRQVQATFRRAKIESVLIRASNPEGFRVYRIWHSHRGSSEGKKVGGANVRKLLRVPRLSRHNCRSGRARCRTASGSRAR